jgi:biotin carboxylase
VAIVDPFSSGAMLAEALRGRKIACVAVLSSARIPESMRSRFDRAAFAAVVEHGRDLEETIEALRCYEPDHVVAGFESGVALADTLSERMSLTTNGTALSSARRDKHEMLGVAHARGLATPRHFRTADLDSALTWIRAEVGWPVILKPAASVASDNIHRCVSADDVERAMSSILSSPNILGETNHDVLVQEFLAGREYVVDTVSVAGQRKVTAFWAYDRPGGDPAAAGYETMRLLPYEGIPQDRLRAFAFEAMDALGIDHGPGHCEIMWVDDDPVLVEVGARLSAGINAVLSGICGGISQLDETVDALLAPETFLASMGDQPRLQRRAANVFLMPPATGRLTRIQGLDVIEQLPTLHSMSVRAEPGDMVHRVAGLVTLVAEDMQAIERDISIIRHLERDGLFQVRPTQGRGGRHQCP